MTDNTTHHSDLTRLLLYVKDVPRVAAFYTRYFGYTAKQLPDDRIVEMSPPGTGVVLMLHQAAKGQRSGQAQVKLVFDVADVPGFCQTSEANGLAFGPIHQAAGYCFANAKDPAGNSISISSRAFV